MNGNITVNQAHYVEKKVHAVRLKTLKPKLVQGKALLSPSEVGSMREVIGALAWLSKETRPDLSGRVALVQQCFPNPTLEDAINTNKIVEDAYVF